MLILLKKKVLFGCKSQISFNGVMETKFRRLWEVAKGGETILQGLDVILRIRRLWRSYHGDHGGPAPPPSRYMKILRITNINRKGWHSLYCSISVHHKNTFYKLKIIYMYRVTNKEKTLETTIRNLYRLLL